MSINGPLSGIRVVSLEQAVAAPLCTARMADAGARVIKIERSEGDFARGYDTAAKGLSSYFVWLNRGKESATFDLKASDDLAIVRNLIVTADVFVQNLAPGASDRLGLSAAELQADNPKLIVVNISGYGTDSIYRNRKAYDLLIQAETGLASVTGSVHAPGRVGVSVCDIACGLNAYSALLEALILRSVTGKGQTIDISLFDSVAEWMTVPLLQAEATGQNPQRVGLNHVSIAPYGVYECADSAVLLAIQNEREWFHFCADILNDADIAQDPRFLSNVERVANRAALDDIIGDSVSGLTEQEFIKRLEDAGIAFGTLNDLKGLSAHPVLRRMDVTTSAGAISIPCPPARFGSCESRAGAVPDLGEHSIAIRKEFGVTT